MLNTMLHLEGKKSVLIVAVAGIAIVTVLAVILGTLSLIHKSPQAEAISDKSQKDIEQEFHQTAPVTGAIVIQSGSMRWIDHGIISAAYKTQESYESIKLHYDYGLTSRGWRYKHETSVKYDGVDYGGKELIYCKTAYVAHLQYAGRQETEFGWTFSFAITWGPSDECK